MDTAPSRRHTGIYLLAVGMLSAFTILLLYGVFSAGFTDGVESFIADPPGTIQENPLGVLSIVGIFLSLFALVAVVVIGGAQYAELDDSADRPE